MKRARCHCHKCRECLIGNDRNHPTFHVQPAPQKAYRKLIDLVPRSVATCFIDALILSEKRNGQLPSWTKSPECLSPSDSFSNLSSTIPPPAKGSSRKCTSPSQSTSPNHTVIPAVPCLLHQIGNPRESPPLLDTQISNDGLQIDDSNVDDSITQFDVAKMSASEIWSGILVRRDWRGGALTRSLLVAASTDASCLPFWMGVRFMEQKVQPRRDQCNAFIEHFNSQLKLAWLRTKLVSIVTNNNRMYSKLHAVLVAVA